jgi:hypothetical protein
MLGEFRTLKALKKSKALNELKNAKQVKGERV